MGIAFEMALASRGPTLAHANPFREALARKIIELAKAGERDPERLCEGALKDTGSIRISELSPSRSVLRGLCLQITSERLRSLIP